MNQQVLERGKRKKVVILGGGYAGTTVAKELDRLVDVTLVERQNYFTHTFGTLRALCSKAFAPLVLVPYDKLLRDGSVVRGEVTDISATSVIVRNPDGKETRSVPYDFLVVSTGAAWNFPARPAATDARKAVEELEAGYDAIAAGSRILVIGGGSVGVELAAELKYFHPSKAITLVHRSQELVATGLSAKFYSNLLASLQRLNVEVVLGEDVAAPSELAGRPFYAGPAITVRSAAGREFVADVVFRCTGTSKATGHLDFFASRGALDPSGRLRVNSYLQVRARMSRVRAVKRRAAKAAKATSTSMRNWGAKFSHGRGRGCGHKRRGRGGGRWRGSPTCSRWGT